MLLRSDIFGGVFRHSACAAIGGIRKESHAGAEAGKHTKQYTIYHTVHGKSMVAA
jgi:hypothetical protein